MNEDKIVCGNPWDAQSERVYCGDGAWHSLSSNNGGAVERRHPRKALGLDHVLLSGGTTYQGRGWYDEVSGCLKTQPHGVMILYDDQQDDDADL